MVGRPTRTALVLMGAALAAAVAVATWRAPDTNWDLALLAILAGLSVVGDLTAVDTAAHKIKISGSFLAIVIAIVFLGGTAAALIGVVTILASIPRWRTTVDDLLLNLVTYAWFPLASGIAFRETLTATGASDTDPLFYVLVFGAFVLALAINFTFVAGYSCYLERSSFYTKVRRALVPILPTELASALLAVGIAYVYVRLGLAAMVLFGIVLLTFQYLIGALLVSQQRGDELELRARQLAGFQVALLSALLRTLDLRDRMTARHSAAVARYAREIAAEAGLSPEDQELAHTAGLLHDIGKFIFPDRILKADEKLTEDDWETIRMHPEEGARIVAQIDGYRPVGEIILAHHERIDGKGYPRGLRGDEIHRIARVIAVADVYDVMTARDSYREPVNPHEAIAELRRVAGTQLDGRFVDAFIETLASKGVAYRHGEDADFDAELGLEKRIHDYVRRGAHGERARGRTRRGAPTGV
jgi:putative nucleotidyltransferase with HDIG domain